MSTMRVPSTFLNPKEIAEAGERIYREKYRAELERSQNGLFVAIDVVSEEAFTANQPEEALEIARKKHSDGVFHLIRIGSPGAFKLGSFSI